MITNLLYIDQISHNESRADHVQDGAFYLICCNIPGLYCIFSYNTATTIFISFHGTFKQSVIYSEE